MPISKSATKAARQSKKKHIRVVSIKNRLKALNKKLLALKKAEEAKKLAVTFIPEIQRSALKNIIHKNKARRMISGIQKHLNSLTK
ncbi:MAG: 30S ribosomal protein S20 [Candidatus Firestonebacteria bacterium]